MKRLFMVSVAALSLLFVSHEGAYSQPRFGVGLRTGMNFGGISVTPDGLYQGKGGRTTFLVGGVFELEFGRIFAPEIGLLFVGKGMTYPQGIQGGGIGPEVTTRISELAIPILFKVKFLPGSQVRPYGFVGPELGFILSGTQSSEQQGLGGFGGQFGAQEQTVAGISGVDFSLAFGGGAEFMVIRNLGVFLDVRYSLGLSGVYSPPNQQQGFFDPQQQNQQEKWTTYGFQLQLGGMYHF